MSNKKEAKKNIIIVIIMFYFSYEMEGKEALHYVNMCVFVSGPGP